MQSRWCTTRDFLKERARQEQLKSEPGGVTSVWKDGTDTWVKVREWHYDHAPSLTEVLRKKPVAREKMEEGKVK